MTFDRVFRNSAPSGYKGRPCRIVARPALTKDKQGEFIQHVGDETVLVEFEDGEQLRCIRSAAVPLDSKLGRQAIRVAKLGMTRMRRRTVIARAKADKASPRATS